MWKGDNATKTAQTPASSSSASSASSSRTGPSISKTGSILIGVGIGLAFAIVLATVVWCLRRRRQKRAAEPHSRSTSVGDSRVAFRPVWRDPSRQTNTRSYSTRQTPSPLTRIDLTPTQSTRPRAGQVATPRTLRDASLTDSSPGSSKYHSVRQLDSHVSGNSSPRPAGSSRFPQIIFSRPSFLSIRSGRAAGGSVGSANPPVREEKPATRRSFISSLWRRSRSPLPEVVNDPTPELDSNLQPSPAFEAGYTYSSSPFPPPLPPPPIMSEEVEDAYSDSDGSSMLSTTTGGIASTILSTGAMSSRTPSRAPTIVGRSSTGHVPNTLGLVSIFDEPSGPLPPIPTQYRVYIDRTT